jgi:hypothetical protein
MVPAGKRGIAAVAVSITGAVIIGLISMVVASQSRITAVEVKVQAIEKMLDENKVIMERNRQENNGAHDRILDEIRGMAKK